MDFSGFVWIPMAFKWELYFGGWTGKDFHMHVCMCYKEKKGLEYKSKGTEEWDNSDWL